MASFMPRNMTAHSKRWANDMNESDKYLFDLRGYLVVRNALTPDQVVDLSERLEQARALKREKRYSSNHTVFTTLNTT